MVYFTLSKVALCFANIITGVLSMNSKIKGQIITITGVDTIFDLQQVIRSLRFVIHGEACDGEKVDLNFEAMSVTAKFVHTGFSWRYPEVSDSFCQLCDLMVALHCQSIHEMVDKMLFLNTYEGKTVLSADGKHWHIYRTDIEAGASAGCTSGQILTDEQANQYLLG